MNESAPIDDHLLVKYIAGEADAAEQLVVQEWASASAANARELERMRSVWDLGAEADADVHVDRAFKMVQDRIAEAEGNGRVVPMRTWRPQSWIAAAAAVAAIVLIARWWPTTEAQRFVAANEFKQVVLADSSAVVLSPGSRVSARIGDERSIELKGEAYFEVKRDEERPFVIDAGDVEVTVLGTAFTVDAFDTARYVLVRVREGRVQVVASNDTVVIGAREHVGYDRQEHSLWLPVAAPRFEVWGERIIHFEDAPLISVVIELEKIFPVNIQLGNAAIANCRLTATFEDEPIDRILGVIAETYGLTLTTAADGYYGLDGDGCQ